MTRSWLRGVPLTLALALVGGCAGEEMAPFGRLTSLRVLAIQSDPVTPMPGETTTLTPLIYVPEGQSEPELSWSWCPFPGPPSEGYPCEASPEAFAPGEGGGVPLELPPLELGVGPTMTFTNTLPPELLGALCSAATPMLRCDDGFPVQIKLRVKTDEDEVIAVRELHLGFEPRHAENTIPLFPDPALELRVDGEWTPVTEDFAGPVIRDRSNRIQALVTDDQAQDYDLVDPNGTPQTEKERLTISWFVESGDTKFQRTGPTEGVTGFEVLNQNEWFPDRADDYERDTSELVLVLRDNREGVSWWRHTFELAEEP